MSATLPGPTPCFSKEPKHQITNRLGKRTINERTISMTKRSDIKIKYVIHKLKLNTCNLLEPHLTRGSWKHIHLDYECRRHFHLHNRAAWVSTPRISSSTLILPGQEICAVFSIFTTTADKGLKSFNSTENCVQNKELEDTVWRFIEKSFLINITNCGTHWPRASNYKHVLRFN